MNLLTIIRSTTRSSLWIAGLALFALYSGTAAATLIIDETIEIAFDDGANLNIVFSGDTGVNDRLEYEAMPFPPPVPEVTSFIATYTEAGPPMLGPITWSGVGLNPIPIPPGDLATLLFDNTGPGLIALNAAQFGLPGIPPTEYLLLVGSAVQPGSVNLVEIVDLFNGEVVAFVPLPTLQQVPAPATLALLGLGLAGLGLSRRKKA